MTTLRLEFGPKSAIVDALKNDKLGQLPWKLHSERITFEFTYQDGSTANPKTRYLREGLRNHRSPSAAKITLSNLSFALKHDLKIPRDSALSLARALDRIIEKDRDRQSEQITCVSFLYGKQERVGAPDKDLMEKFEIFSLVEQLNVSLGKLSSSRKTGVGAYEMTSELLSSKRVYMDIDQVKSIRQQVRSKATKDLDFMFLLFHYLLDQGFKMKQAQ